MLCHGIILLIGMTVLIKCEAPLVRTGRAVVPVDAIPWPKEVIPYIIDKPYFSAEELELLDIAIKTWNSETCILLRPYNTNDKRWVRITDGVSCFSEYLGYRGMPGEQKVTFSKHGCRYYGLYLHELGHVIGLDHEHVRADRNIYIDVNVQGVLDHYKPFFSKKSPDELKTYDSPYDLQSIMQYGKSSLSVFAGHDPITVKNEKERNILRDVYMKDISFWDTRTVNLHYRCQDKCPTPPNCPFPGYIDEFCKCHTPSDFAKRRCVDKLQAAECAKLVEKLECYRNASFMTAHCSKACEFCYQDAVSDTSKPEHECKDRQENCRDLAKAGHCTATSSYMKMMCPQSCDFCNLTTSVTGEESECRDLYLYPSDCEAWSREGKCRNNVLWMSYNCAKSCGLCSDSRGIVSFSQITTPPPITTTKVSAFIQPDSCVDNYGEQNCRLLASRHMCSQHRSWMERQCSATCGFCRSGASTTTLKPQTLKTPSGIARDNDEASKAKDIFKSRCRNGDPPRDCPQYYSYCNRVDTFQRCPNICKNCGQCEDKSRDCEVLKRNGYCHHYPGSTIPVCRRTCGVCFE